MNTFDLAKLKHAKNLERRTRTEQAIEPVAEPIETPKEKVPGPNSAAVIEVKVTLPTGEFSFTLIKAGVMQNANPSRLNRNEFINRIKSGLEPLLGGLQ
jgi:hypothetical protein